MIWDKVNMQDFVTGVLSAHIQKGRLAPTYLLTGQAESGKEEMALAFAAALNCEQGNYFKSCLCGSCRKTFSRQHPDALWIGSDESKKIKIEEIREALNWVCLKPYEGQWKVFIVKDADRLTLEAANAFLKTLEEPPAKTIFLLLAEVRAHLMETIQSRSFELRLRPLVTELNPSEEYAQQLARVGGGSWDDYFEPYHSKDRQNVRECFQQLMLFFRSRMRAGDDKPDALRRISSYVKAFDKVYETMDALEANANQKLALSRLAMQLTKIFSARN